MGLKILKEGLFTSIQDRGRFGYAGIGVPQSGAMDRYSAKIANMLVGNDASEAVMECTLIGPKILFEKDALIVLVALDAEVVLNKEIIPLLKAIKVKKGDKLHIKQVTQGARLYMAINGGFQTKEVLNSKSFYAPLTKNKKVGKQESLAFSTFTDRKQKDFAKVNYEKEGLATSKIKVFKGPEWHLLPENLQQEIVKNDLHFSKNTSRMAYQIEEKFPNDLDGMLSQPVLSGTVQLTPDGNLIILMRDAQTTGGYPRVLQLSEESINTVAQKKQGDLIELELVDLE